MLKILENTESITQLEKGGIGVSGDSRARRDSRYKFDRNKVDGGKGGDSKNNEVGKKSQKTTKSKNLSKSKNMVQSSDFLIFRARLAFTKLR